MICKETFCESVGIYFEEVRKMTYEDFRDAFGMIDVNEMWSYSACELWDNMNKTQRDKLVNFIINKRKERGDE